jgi:outer membrane protein TolC
MEIKSRIFSIFILSVSILTTSAFPQNGGKKNLSLRQALEASRTNNYQLLIARSQIDQASGQNLESWSGILPRLAISENYYNSNDPVAVFSMKLKQGVFSEEDFDINTLNNPDAFHNWSTVFHLQQPILNLDAFFGKSAAQNGVKASEKAYERAKETVDLFTIKAYYGLILARENLNALSDAVESALAHRDNADAAFREGLLNEADYLAAEVRLAELQEHRITAEHQVANASDQLKFIIGLSDESTIIPSDSLVLPAGQNSRELPESLAARSDLLALQFKQKAARRNLWLQRSGWIPRLNAFGAVEWNASKVFSKQASNWAVGLQLQWQVFEGLTRERIAVATTAVAQAGERLRISEERFREGLEKTPDRLTREAAFTNAKLRLLKARHDHAVAIHQLRFATGVEVDQT